MTRCSKHDDDNINFCRYFRTSITNLIINLVKRQRCLSETFYIYTSYYFLFPVVEEDRIGLSTHLNSPVVYRSLVILRLLCSLFIVCIRMSLWTLLDNLNCVLAGIWSATRSYRQPRWRDSVRWRDEPKRRVEVYQRTSVICHDVSHDVGRTAATSRRIWFAL